MRVITALIFLATGAVPATAQGLCFCPLCLLGTHKSYAQSSESMAPGLRPGDCLTVKLGTDAIKPGQIVAYRHPGSGFDHVMRLIATEGQSIEIRDGVPIIDGKTATREPLSPLAMTGAVVCPEGQTGDCEVPRFRETLPGGASYAVLDAVPDSITDHMARQSVPPGHIFVLGDHRDNAMDSRILPDMGGPGMLPVANVIGIVDHTDVVKP
ncbi:signal peptidase I [Paracoccus caeni]|uniref:Signal peptidase I n=1 Tax=Paracoccus caeni TaxID=657651 RepID=A0A934W2I3_9RHOB|nr:signal peptidase I [Paracoccus caeni]MBK4217814.1 signal peptidase I [Paracoccus caeni]